MKRVGEEYVLKRASTLSPLVVLDGQVVDLSGFLEHHPGGAAVLLANLGRDVSADFHHVTAHARLSVIRKVGQKVIAEVDRAAIPLAREDFGRLLDYVRLVLNSFEAQFDPERDPVRDLVYVGQLYCHFVGDHLRSFLSTLSALTGLEVDSKVLRHLDQIFELAPSRVEEVIVAANKSAAAVLSRRMQVRCIALLNDLLVIGADAVGMLRVTGNETILSTQLGRALSVVTEWTREEYDLVVGG